jgi:hypothetical protein
MPSLAAVSLKDFYTEEDKAHILGKYLAVYNLSYLSFSFELIFQSQICFPNPWGFFPI